MFRSIVILLKKDLSIEIRSKETLVLILGLSTLLALVGAFGLNSAALNTNSTQRVFPGILWMIFLFSGTVSLGRSFEHELENSAIEGLLLTGVSSAHIYLAKVVGNFTLTFLSHTLSIVLLAGFCDIPIWPSFAPLLLCSALIVFAFSALTTLLVAPSSTSRLKGFLLPLLLLPLAFPPLLCGLEITSSIMIDHQIAWASPWISLILVLDLAYLVLGLNLYSHVLRE